MTSKHIGAVGGRQDVDHRACVHLADHQEQRHGGNPDLGKWGGDAKEGGPPAAGSSSRREPIPPFHGPLQARSLRGPP